MPLIFFPYHGVTDRHLMRAACPFFFFFPSHSLDPAPLPDWIKRSCVRTANDAILLYGTRINKGPKASWWHPASCWCYRKYCYPALQTGTKQLSKPMHHAQDALWLPVEEAINHCRWPAPNCQAFSINSVMYPFAPVLFARGRTLT